HSLDDRHELLGQELLALLAALPDVEDAKDPGIVVEAGSVDQKAVGGLRQVEGRRDGVVVGRARVTVAGLELLQVGNRHPKLLSSRVEGMLGDRQGNRGATSAENTPAPTRRIAARARSS